MSELSNGNFCWNELITSDTEGAKTFYTSLFGWETSVMDMGGMEYTMFNIAGAPEGPEGMAGGMMQAPMPEAPIAWVSYVLVEDVGASLAKAVALGATMIKDVTELPMGTMAVFSDPQGAILALWKKKPCPGE